MTENHQFKPIDDVALLKALNELSRAINISSTYGKNHPAALSATETTATAMHDLMLSREQVLIGSFNGAMTIDEVPVQATGTLIKSLERRLIRLGITGLKISRGISKTELQQLTGLLTVKEASEFEGGMDKAGLPHVSKQETEFHAVHDDELVANKNDLGISGGVLVLDDDEAEEPPPVDVHVEQIVAFLKGDAEGDDDSFSEELTELASNPARLGKLIMESVAIRQSASELSGESLSDIVVGCLRRTYSGLRKQPTFQSPEGKADLRKALLLLEENVLEKLRDLTEGDNPELDREIVQAIREMDEELSFELAAVKYNNHLKALETNKKTMLSYARNQGQEAADELVKKTELPLTHWHRIVVGDKEDKKPTHDPIASGIDSLANVFEKLETVIKSSETHENEVKNLIGQANENLDDTIDTTREKLDQLSKQLQVAKAGTIGGHGRKMDQRELLASLSEVAQELMQPLTAVNASLEMLLHGFAGEINEEQRDLLKIATNSSEHLRYLMIELIHIVGCPTNKGVDNRYHTTSDDVAGQKHLPLGYFK